MKKVLLFPGQGSQYVGMGQKILDYEPAFKLLEQANNILGFDLKTMMLHGPVADLNQTQNTQPALFVSSMMVFEYFKEKEFNFDFVAGHSLGEYSALCAAGCFSFEEGLRLVRLRGELMEQAGNTSPGTMLAILGLPMEIVEQIVHDARDEGQVVMANYNTPVQVVISGEKKAVEKAQNMAAEAGAKRLVPLAVSGPFHSPLMNKVLEPLEAALNKATMNDIKTPVISNIDATPEINAKKIREKLVKQLVFPVRWVLSVEKMISLGVMNGYELGAGKVLKGLVRNIAKELKVETIESLAECQQILDQESV